MLQLSLNTSEAIIAHNNTFWILDRFEIYLSYLVRTLQINTYSVKNIFCMSRNFNISAKKVWFFNYPELLRFQ